MQKIILFTFISSSILAYSDWKDIGPPSGVTLGVYCHPTKANIIYYIADTGHLFRSVDKGNSWQRISQRVALETMPWRQYRGGEHGVAIDPRPEFGNIVYFSPGQRNVGLWKSEDYGTIWFKTRGPSSLSGSAIAVDYNGVIFCITGNRNVVHSTDGGTSWTDYPVPFQIYSDWYSTLSYKVDIEISKNNYLWITNRFENEGIYYSPNKGKIWTQTLSTTWIVDMTCSPVNPNLILALEQDGRIFRSTNNGQNFSQTGKARQNNYWSWDTWPPHKGCISLNNQGTVIAVGRYGQAISKDSGKTFMEIIEKDIDYSAPQWPFIDRKTSEDQSCKCCAMSSSPKDTNLWIYGDGVMLKRSMDNGLSWEGGKNTGIHGLWMYGNPCPDAVDPNVFHAACVDFGHAYTTNLGETWISTETERTSCQGVAQDPNDPDIYYKTTKRNDSSVLSIHKSTDRGHRFTRISDITLASESYGGRIFVDPTDSGTLYCTIRGGYGVYRSTDSGTTFLNIYSKKNIHHSMITQNGHVFFHIWNGSGLYRYLKNSDDWADIAQTFRVDGFAVHPENENIIFMNADGVLYKTISGLDSDPVWEQMGTFSGRQIYIDPYKPQYMLMMTDQKDQGMLYSSDWGNTWENIHQNLGTSFVWGFVSGGPSAKGRVFAFDATAYYIDDIYNSNLNIKEKDDTDFSQSFSLGEAYPNPFNANTHIPFTIYDSTSMISLIVYDIDGHIVRKLIMSTIPAGSHLAYWDGRNDSGTSVGSGLYIVMLRIKEEFKSHKLVLIK
jgi:photosystem II stability/assembly factor-like uncharacterized protein